MYVCMYVCLLIAKTYHLTIELFTQVFNLRKTTYFLKIWGLRQ